MMTLVAEKRSGDWLVIVGQNTNAILGVPPELQDIKTPIAIPGTSQGSSVAASRLAGTFPITEFSGASFMFERLFALNHECARTRTSSP